MKSIKDKLKDIAADEHSKWIKKAEWRIANEHWLDYSAKIAINILRALKETDMTQKSLADKLQVSPQYVANIIKGEENLTLETISKLEQALSIRLIEVTKAPVKLKSRKAGIHQVVRKKLAVNK